MSNLHQSVVDQVRARIGSTLKDKWHIDALIGMGGMAAVYSATHRNGSRVAIKMLHPALSINDGVRKRFAREGYVANAIGHPGVARVLDDDVAEDGSAFIVMELLEGETAAARAERFGGKLPIHEVAFVGEAVAEVLAAAHASNVIHRDIKPDNVFITHDGRVVVLDFGIARVADATGMSDSNTRTGTMMGTPAFMPPEQARGRSNEMDATSDVWALGATLFWLASGRLVHEAETPNEQLVAAATLPPVSLGRVAPELPTPLIEVIDKALAFSKENRFRDAVALQQALHAAVLEIAWEPGVRPGIASSTIPPQVEGDETVVDVGTPPALRGYSALGANLPVSGRDDATTIAQKAPFGSAARGPTIGPVEMGETTGRASKFVRAALVGGVVGAIVLAAVAVVGKRNLAPASATPSTLTVTSPSTSTSTSSSTSPTSSTSPSTTTTSEIADAVPVASASSSIAPVMRPLPATSAGTRKNWLDRRK